MHVWALAPIGIDNHQRGPAVLEVHGGPHCQYGCTYYNEFQVLAASGLEVVYSNPRGSKGYGEDHCMAIRADWGNKDWVDIEAVTHWMQNQPNIHPGQLGIMGGSYGGYMTNWAVSHSDAYKAAITDRCVSNFTSMGGNSDFVDEKDVGIGVNGDGESEADEHAAGIGVDRVVDEVFDAGEGDDAVERAVDVGAGKAEDAAVEVDVFAAGKQGVKACAEFEQGCDASADGDAAGGRRGDAGDDFEQRAFAGTVRADEAEGFAGVDGEGDVLKRVKRRGFAAAQEIAESAAPEEHACAAAVAEGLGDGVEFD